MFKLAFLRVLQEDVVAGGANSAFGHGTQVPIGGLGNQFPSQNDIAYAPGDARMPKILGFKKKKRKNIFLRRRLSNSGL